MAMSSSSRFLLDPAPGGLALVQDLVNTRPVAPYGVRDLLGTVADAQRFTAEVARGWKEHSGADGGPGRISSADLVGLRRLRRDVERALTDGTPARSVAGGVPDGAPSQMAYPQVKPAKSVDPLDPGLPQ